MARLFVGSLIQLYQDNETRIWYHWGAAGIDIIWDVAPLSRTGKMPVPQRV